MPDVTKNVPNSAFVIGARLIQLGIKALISMLKFFPSMKKYDLYDFFRSTWLLYLELTLHGIGEIY